MNLVLIAGIGLIILFAIAKQSNQKAQMCQKQVLSFLHAAEQGKVFILKDHLKNGMTVDAQDNYGNTALICAVRSQKIEAVQLLLKYQASVTKRNRQNKNALSYAHNSSIRRFLKRKAA